MKIENFISEKYLNIDDKYLEYRNNIPFKHIVLDNFIKEELLEKVLREFPDLSKIKDKIEYKNQKEIKFATKGFKDISESGTKLISFLNSDIFLEYLTRLTGIEQNLISDPYLIGGGYHEIKSEGFLKVHTDFNKHSMFDLDRRINLLLYLNKDWKKEWGGKLEFYKENKFDKPIKSINPIFNRCVIFNTTSFTYHGHPDPIRCPSEISRKSIALYYFSSGRPSDEYLGEHGTEFVETKGEKLKMEFDRNFIIDLIPPIIMKIYRKYFKKKTNFK
jgi:Rps23 Pro-64 3,4-dihydroxylase Tpa1-like proline 4-hydroxylase|tara:strand:+ start:185 stop:1009 length:825 start_codon:yes stop_codon:yes gene_type:complete